MGLAAEGGGMKNMHLVTDDPQTFLVVYRERLTSAIQTQVMECVILWGCLLIFIANKDTSLITIMSGVLLTISLVNTGVLWGSLRVRRTFDKLMSRSSNMLQRNISRVAYIGRCSSQRLVGHSLFGAASFFVAGGVALVCQDMIGLILIPWAALMLFRVNSFSFHEELPQTTSFSTFPKI